MKIFILFIFIFFLTSKLFAENAYVMDENSPGTKKCYEVLNDLQMELKGPELFGKFDDPERLAKYINQEAYWAFYYGLELGVAMALDKSINSTFSRRELTDLFIKHCGESKSNDKFFQILPGIHRSKFE